MPLLLVAFSVSALAALLLLRSTRSRAYSGDTDLHGPQKFHARSVPRAGGVALMMGLLAAAIALLSQDVAEPAVGLWLVACSLPAFAAGLAEDITKRISPRRRLLATALSAALAVWLLDVAINRTDLPGLDTLVAYPAGALAVTMFVVAGVANSFNIIDGFNGLASMCGMLILLTVAYVAFQANDALVVLLALGSVGAVLGFFVWNYPAGLIFLGDGGAYLLGFYAAELCILLLHRNAQVSPMFPLLVCIYPVFETLFTIYRRRFVRKSPTGLADGIHLHSLVYRRLVRWAVGDRSNLALTRRNSLTSPYLWALCLVSLVPAMLWWDSTPILGACVVGFGIAYCTLYWRIVRFRAPRWMVLRR